MEPTNFKSLNIQTKTKSFVGQSIEVEDIMDQEIIILDYKIGPSKFPEKYEKCLTLQIRYQDKLRVVFSGSKNLIEMIEQIPKDKFPVITTIKKEKETKRHVFS